MKIPLTRFGLPQLAAYPGAVLLVMIALPWLGAAWLPMWGLVSVEVPLAVVVVWMLSFFRDPERYAPQDDRALLSPADGRITDITILNEPAFIQGPALRIGIFLSIFNVHINRMPCPVRVEGASHKPGQYRNAMNPESSRVNESNDVYLTRLPDPPDRLVVRQISGAIARRIVCQVTPGQTFQSGERFGMIKFGSRTELYVAHRDNQVCCVKVGDRVKAGLTVLARYP